MEIRLPQLAEGASSGTVVSIQVAEGDRLQKGQTILELENQKAVAPIPSPAAGRVTKIHVKQGETVSAGQTLISLEPGSVRGEPPIKSGAGPVEPRTPSAHPASPFEGFESESGAPAPPGLRKVAREVGLDLTRIPSSARGGRLTREDVQSYMAWLQDRAARGGAPAALPDFSKWGPVSRKPFTPTRQAIARAMSQSWGLIPHVTQFHEAGAGRILEFIEKRGAEFEKKEGTRLTLTAFLLKTLAEVLKKHPLFNSSLDEGANEIILKQSIHIGVAVDTEHGLIVPVLRDVDQKGLAQISKELADLAERTRARKVKSEELEGAGFTLSNQGGIGGGHFTPIIHWPEVAVLGVGRAVEGKLPLSLSYDHRVIDGADAARFVTALAQAIEQFRETEL